MADVLNARQNADRSTAQLVQHTAEQVAKLVRDEMALARAELSEKGRRAGVGMGLLGGSGVVALFGVGTLTAAVVLLLALAMPAWVAALLVAVALFAAAAVGALIGRKQVRQATPAVPREAVDGVRADVDTMTSAFRQRGRR